MDGEQQPAQGTSGILQAVHQNAGGQPESRDHAHCDHHQVRHCPRPSRPTRAPRPDVHRTRDQGDSDKEEVFRRPIGSTLGHNAAPTSADT